MTNEIMMGIRNLLKVDDSFKAQVKIAKTYGVSISEVIKLANR